MQKTKKAMRGRYDLRCELWEVRAASFRQLAAGEVAASRLSSVQEEVQHEVKSVAAGR
jgi:hypothetical protein